MLSVPELISDGAYPKHRSLSRTGFIPSTGAYSERNLFQAPVLIPDGASPKHRSFSRTELIPCTGTYIGRSLSQAPKLIPNGVYSKHWSLSHNVFQHRGAGSQSVFCKGFVTASCVIGVNFKDSGTN